jgi:cysteine synthase
MIHSGVEATVGRTPMVALRRISSGLHAEIVVKLESRNPCGSVKDRVGFAMIDDAEKRGLLGPGATLVEPTSGNTGIALAYVSAARGYKLKLTMPETMGRERLALLLYLGADVVLTPGALMKNAVERARAIVAATPGAIMFDQFKNPANPEIHRRTTATEIWEQTDGRVDVFVAGVGTGGTITGVGQVLKAKNKGVLIVAVEPTKAAVLSGKTAGSHVIQGIGAGFIPEILDRSVIDEVIAIAEGDAFACGQRLASEEGILAGVSSGAALAAALQIARRPSMKGKRIVTVVCDTGERYVTTPLMPALARGRG